MMDVTWDSYYEKAEILAKKIQASDWDFDHIVCIARGGMPLGDMLSRLFKKPLAIILASSYRGAEGMEQKQLYLSEIAKISNLGSKVLLVDDLTDTGKTLKEILSYTQGKNSDVKEIRTAVLWCKSSSDFKPDYYAEAVDGNVWIKQPFEKYDSISIEELE